MRLVNYKRAWDHEIYEWLEKSIPELTVYQKEAIRDNEIIRFAKFYFVKKIEPVKNIFVRLSSGIFGAKKSMFLKSGSSW